MKPATWEQVFHMYGRLGAYALSLTIALWATVGEVGAILDGADPAIVAGYAICVCVMLANAYGARCAGQEIARELGWM